MTENPTSATNVSNLAINQVFVEPKKPRTNNLRNNLGEYG